MEDEVVVVVPEEAQVAEGEVGTQEAWEVVLGVRETGHAPSRTVATTTLAGATAATCVRPPSLMEMMDLEAWVEVAQGVVEGLVTGEAVAVEDSVEAWVWTVEVLETGAVAVVDLETEVAGEDLETVAQAIEAGVASVVDVIVEGDPWTDLTGALSRIETQTGNKEGLHTSKGILTLK